jgi:hypothetical protein
VSGDFVGAPNILSAFGPEDVSRRGAVSRREDVTLSGIASRPCADARATLSPIAH